LFIASDFLIYIRAIWVLENLYFPSPFPEPVEGWRRVGAEALKINSKTYVGLVYPAS